MKRYSWLLGVLGVCACSGSAIDVGPGSAGAPSGSGTDGTSGNGSSVPAEFACTDERPLPVWPSTDACATGSDLPLVGTWRGYIETRSAPWDDIKLVIRGASVSGGVCGTLTAGSGAIPAPATDPNQAYPDDAQGGPSKLDVTPGFPSTLLRGDTDGTRLRFSISSGEVMRSWCALQDSYPDWEGRGPGVCGCLPNWGFASNGNECRLTDPAGKSPTLNVSTSRCLQCTSTSACTCNTHGCDATPEQSSNDFDLRFSADSAEGVDTGHGGARVHFTRVP